MSNYPDGMSRADLIHVGEIAGDWCEDCECEDTGHLNAEVTHVKGCDEDACASCEHGKDLHVDEMVCELDSCDCREYEQVEECSCDPCQCNCHSEPNYLYD